VRKGERRGQVPGDSVGKAYLCPVCAGRAGANSIHDELIHGPGIYAPRPLFQVRRPNVKINLQKCDIAAIERELRKAQNSAVEVKIEGGKVVVLGVIKSKAN
jgi:hypothetical protein